MAALCVFIALLGIAVMQFCNLLIIPPFSGFAGFTVFMAVAAVIVLIIVNQKKFFRSEYESSLAENAKRDAALRLIRTLGAKGVEASEIKKIIMEKFQFEPSAAEELVRTAGI